MNITRYLASLGLALLMLPLAGESLAQAEPEAPTTIELSLSPSYIPEGSGAGPTAANGETTTITVTASYVTGPETVAPETETVVTITLAGGDGGITGANAVEAADFTAPTGTIMVTIPAGEFSGTTTFDLTVFDVDEGGESFEVTGSTSATGYTVTPAGGLPLVVVDTDNTANYMDLSLSTSSVDEDSDSTVITVTAALPENAVADSSAREVVVSVAGGTATAADFTAVTAFTITFAGDATSGTAAFTLTVTDDDLAESDETLLVSGTLSGVAIRPATLTITANDPVEVTEVEEPTPTPTEIAVSVNPSSIREDAKATTITITTDVTGMALAAATTVTITRADSGTAMINEDFTQTGSLVHLTIAAGESTATGTFVITPTDNGLLEDDKTIIWESTTAAIDPDTNMALEIPDVTLTIIDDEADSKKSVQTAVPEIARASTFSAVNAISNRVSQVATGSLGSRSGGSTRLVANALASHEQGLNDGTTSLENALAGSYLSAGQAETGMQLGIWGSIDYQDFSSRNDTSGKWNGKQTTLHAGVDGHVAPTALVGVAISRSRGDITFEDVGGIDTKNTLIGVSPYVGWHTLDGWRSAWATVSHNRGDLEQKSEGVKTDLEITSLAIGGEQRISARGGIELKIKTDLSTARVSTDAVNDFLPATKETVSRVRIAGEAEAITNFPDGTQLIHSGSIGLRHDTGEGDSGTGLEIGAEVQHRPESHGLHFSGYGNAMLFHSSALKQWGIGGLVRYTQQHGRGVSFQMQPAYGAQSDPDRIWESNPSDLGSLQEPEASLSARTGYGIAALDGIALTTPYTELELAESGSQTLSLGTEFEMDSHFHLDLATTHTIGNDGPETAIGIQVSFSW